MEKITLVIPTYNRCDLVIKSFINVLDNDIVEEIVINDDFSDENIFENLKKELNKINSNKIKLFRNEKNLGAFNNKYQSVKKSKNDWVILLDSDNIIKNNYLLSLPIKKDKSCLYLPNKAICSSPLLNYSEFSGIVCDKIKYKNKALSKDNKTQCLLNTGNYFFNRDSYLEAIEKNNDLLDPFAADVFYFIFLWFKNIKNASFFVVDNMSYEHYLHTNESEEGSHYTKNSVQSQNFIRKLQKEIVNL